ncbi:MAG: hypothetical protein K2O45_05285 [Oscillospiraceae bacterium]|nr:hypothetical protein [Oscillospiraceae bacterium]
MTAIEIARKLDQLGQVEEACRAYGIAIHELDGKDPAAQMEAAVYIFQNGGDYKVSFTCFRDLYNQGNFRAECFDFLTTAFYEPNKKELKTRYEKNCKLLSKYPYLFQKDFLPFEELPARFYPFDEKGFVPYYVSEERFGDYKNFDHPRITRNFFKNLDDPILAADVYSQYELEYLNDNVRKSEFVGKENHIYLHYTDWAEFCAQLQCLNMRPLLKDEKFVFLIGNEVSQYPIDFKERYGIDYSLCPVKPLGIREINKIIWHTQLSTHNGGDFFNEIFDNHPNLLALTSVMFSNIEEIVADMRENLARAKSSKAAEKEFVHGQKENSPRIMRELCRMKDPSDKDIFVAFYLSDYRLTKPLDKASRIVPAIFFQPHFPNIVYGLCVNAKDSSILSSDQYDKTAASPIFRGFKYIKTFTPMRRFTNSHGATVKFMYNATLEAEDERKKDGKKGESAHVVADAVTQRILNRSFMIDWQDRLYQDCVLVRFEDGKLNAKATFTALAAFLDVPYTESMTYCSVFGERDAESYAGNDRGFDPAAIYRTYDDYVNNAERTYIEYFLRDAYAYYGYDFQYYDGQPMEIEQLDELTEGFSTLDHYIRETWKKVFMQVKVSLNDKQIDEKTERQFQEDLLEKQMESFHENRKKNSRILMRGLYFVNRKNQPLHMMPRLELDPALLEQPLYH